MHLRCSCLQERAAHLARGGSVIAAVAIACMQVACLGGRLVVAIVARLAVGLIAALTLLCRTISIPSASTARMYPAKSIRPCQSEGCHLTRPLETETKSSTLQ